MVEHENGKIKLALDRIRNIAYILMRMILNKSDVMKRIERYGGHYYCFNHSDNSFFHPEKSAAQTSRGTLLRGVYRLFRELLWLCERGGGKSQKIAKSKKGHFYMSFFYFFLSQKSGICYTEI